MRLSQKYLLIGGCLFAMASWSPVNAGDHGGSPVKETQEHGGEEVQEHGGKAVHDYSEKEIKKAIRKHVRKMSKSKRIRGVAMENVMTLRDKGKKLRLKFVKVHDPVRKLKNNKFFACTDFQVAGVKAKKRYDIDFWLKPNKKGELIVYNTKIHKHPVKKKGKWVKKARYTFRGEQMVPLP